MPGIEQEDSRSTQFIFREFIALILHLHQFSDEIILRFDTAFRGKPADHFHEFGGGAVGFFNLLVCVAQLIHLDNGVRPRAQILDLLIGNTKQTRDHDDRQRLGDIMDKVRFAAGFHSINEFVSGAFKCGTHAFHTFRREDLRHQRTDAGMGVRFHIHEDVVLIATEGRFAWVGRRPADLVA